MNKALLVGRLTRDPELRTTPGGLAVTRFAVAVSEPYTNRNGERETNYINCSAFGRQADNISKYCHKGSLVSVEGRIRTGSYDAQDGTKRYTTEIVCDRVNFLTPKGGNSAGENYSGGNNYSSTDGMAQGFDEPFNNGPMETADLSEDPFKSFGEEIALSSDDLPF